MPPPLCSWRSILLSETCPNEPLQTPKMGKAELLAYFQQAHKLTHLGTKKLCLLARNQSTDSQLSATQIKELAEQVTKSCQACQVVNAFPSKSPEGKRLRGTRLGQFWEVDFTEIKPTGYGLKYLLVFIDTFSGWTEAFPTKMRLHPR